MPFVSVGRTKEDYAFPPFALIRRCLQKVREERATLVLVAPMWSVQSWYPALLELLISNPLLLPKGRNLLTDLPPNGRSAINRLERVRRQHNDMGVSDRSSNLIMDGWSTGTNMAYQSAWKRWWCGWCAERKLIPFMWNPTLLGFLSRPFWTGLATLNHQSDTFSHFNDSPAGRRNFYWTAPTGDKAH